MKLVSFIPLMVRMLGVEEKTLRMYLKYLRDAGMFSTGARGVNAPDITALDAARVIVAVLASPSPSRAVKDVEFFGALLPAYHECDWGPLEWFAHQPDKTLLEVVVDCLEGEVPFEAVHCATLRLSDDGKAQIERENFKVIYHERALSDATHEASSAKEAIEIVRNAETMKRMRSTRFVRSAVFGMEEILEIGPDLLGCEPR
ncbi:MAG: hypothetical protein PHX82_06720 [Paracoccaceae bacterium]|nr:hypothetical protein [Paracoccaceae bacterium]